MHGPANISLFQGSVIMPLGCPGIMAYPVLNPSCVSGISGHIHRLISVIPGSSRKATLWRDLRPPFVLALFLLCSCAPGLSRSFGIWSSPLLDPFFRSCSLPDPSSTTWFLPLICEPSQSPSTSECSSSQVSLHALSSSRRYPTPATSTAHPLLHHFPVLRCPRDLHPLVYGIERQSRNGISE